MRTSRKDTSLSGNDAGQKVMWGLNFGVGGPTPQDNAALTPSGEGRIAPRFNV
jgi:hypothetical protein